MKEKKKNDIQDQKEVFSRVNFVKSSPQKLMRVANLVRRRSVLEVLATLKLMPHKSAYLLYKAIHSAKSNAVHNNQLDEGKLVVSTLQIDKGPFSSRFRARARGRSATIEKKTSKILVGISEMGGA